jgi:pheromone shutdown-related protein TraB
VAADRDFAGTAPAEADAPNPRGYPSDVVVVERDGRRVVLVGTAHVSRESVELVQRVIAEERPDRVCVELDAQRFEVLTQRKKWEASDLREVMRKRQLATLVVHMVLSSYQKRIGGKLGVVPGSELLEAVRAAEALGVPVELCDREVRITLRRAWSALSFWKKSVLLSSLLVGMSETPDLDEEALRKLRERDALNEMMQELGRAFPALKLALIDERDAFLAAKIRAAEGGRLVVVVGAGHVQGMRRALEQPRDVDLAALSEIPPPSPWGQAIGWGIGLLIVGSILAIGWTKGVDAMRDSAVYWVLATGGPSALGTALAAGHPLAVLSGFVAAPFTALSPVIGAGYVTAFVQAYVVPPRVHEFQSASEDVGHPRRWWGNRLLRVLLVFVLTSLGGAAGTLMGGAEIFRALF